MGPLAVSENIFDCHNWGHVTGIKRVASRDASKYPVTHRTAPTTEGNWPKLSGNFRCQDWETLVCIRKCMCVSCVVCVCECTLRFYYLFIYLKYSQLQCVCFWCTVQCPVMYIARFLNGILNVLGSALCHFYSKTEKLKQEAYASDLPI